MKDERWSGEGQGCSQQLQKVPFPIVYLCRAFFLRDFVVLQRYARLLQWIAERTNDQGLSPTTKKRRFLRWRRMGC